MIPFAGFDPKEPPLVPVRRVAKPKAEPKPKREPREPFQSRSARAYFMFLAGKDTLDIAVEMDAPEAKVLRWISEARSVRLRLSRPYEARK